MGKRACFDDVCEVGLASRRHTGYSCAIAIPMLHLADRPALFSLCHCFAFGEVRDVVFSAAACDWIDCEDSGFLSIFHDAERLLEYAFLSFRQTLGGCRP